MKGIVLILVLAGCGAEVCEGPPTWDSVSCELDECRAFWLDAQGEVERALVCDAEKCACFSEMKLDHCPPVELSAEGMLCAWSRGCCR